MGLDDAQRDGHRDGDEDGQADQLEGQRQAIADEVEDVLAQPVAVAQVALERSTQPRHVLAERVADEPELVPEGVGRGRIDVPPAEDDEHRIARGEPDEAERDEGDEQEDGDHRDQAPQRIREDLRPPFSAATEIRRAPARAT